MYGKLENGKFIKARPYIVTKEVTILNPTGEIYEKYGYKKLVADTIPELKDGQSVTIFYEETAKEILKHYKLESGV
jgi:hypothetical protein